MIAKPTIISMSVKPLWRLRVPALPLDIMSPVESDRFALGMYVEDVEPVGLVRARLVATRSRHPVGLAGDRIEREAPQVLPLDAARVAGVVPLVEPLELFGVALFVGRVQLSAGTA